MKYNPSLLLCKTFAEFLSKNIQELFDDKSWDIIVPMPSCKANLKKRGFNHVEEIAIYLSKSCDAKVSPCLEITHPDRHQARLPSLMRFNGIKNLITVRKNCTNALAGKKILLLDDVITTGATSYAAIRAMKGAGCGDIDLLSIALGKRWEMFRSKRAKMWRRRSDFITRRTIAAIRSGESPYG